MSNSRLGPKLETLLVAFIAANKGGSLSGVTVQGGHATAEAQPPFISVWCSGVQRHPSFDGMPGVYWPQRATVEFLIKTNSADASFAASCGVWTDELINVLATRLTPTADETDFSKLLQDANPAGSLHPADGLLIFAVRVSDESSGVDSNQWLSMFSLEIDAQNGDPST